MRPEGWDRLLGLISATLMYSTVVRQELYTAGQILRPTIQESHGDVSTASVTLPVTLCLTTGSMVCLLALSQPLIRKANSTKDAGPTARPSNATDGSNLHVFNIRSLILCLKLLEREERERENTLFASLLSIPKAAVTWFLYLLHRFAYLNMFFMWI